MMHKSRRKRVFHVQIIRSGSVIVFVFPQFTGTQTDGDANETASEHCCEKIRTDDLLLWFNSRKKWRVTVSNHSDAVLYLSWCEAFTNPFDNKLWVSKIDESLQAGDRFVVDAINVKCTNFITSGDEQRFLAPDRFVQIAIHGNQTGSWVMERIKRSHWDGFNVYDESLVYQIQDMQRVPEPVENVFPRISGWLWA